MTRAELEHIRGLIASTVYGCACIDGKGWTQHHVALAILDAELARPETREWRVVFDHKGKQDATPCGSREAVDAWVSLWGKRTPIHWLESRTPAGPWKRAE